jgi:type III secretion protein J
MRLVALALLLGGCGVELEHGLDERSANEVTSALEAGGISADKEPEDGQANAYKVVVTRADQARAFQLLEAHDLPRRGQRGLADTFPSGGLMPSPVEDRARYGAALAAELERSLDEIPGVVSARVHLALPPDEPMFADSARARPTASVLLKLDRDGRIADGEVKRLVAGAVHGLQIADVSVVTTSAVQGPSGPVLARVGPLSVAKGSERLTTVLAASGLGVILLLALGLVLVSWRLGNLRRQLPVRTPPPSR